MCVSEERWCWMAAMEDKEGMCGCAGHDNDWSGAEML